MDVDIEPDASSHIEENGAVLITTLEKAEQKEKEKELEEKRQIQKKESEEKRLKEDPQKKINSDKDPVKEQTSSSTQAKAEKIENEMGEKEKGLMKKICVDMSNEEKKRGSGPIKLRRRLISEVLMIQMISILRKMQKLLSRRQR